MDLEIDNMMDEGISGAKALLRGFQAMEGTPVPDGLEALVGQMEAALGQIDFGDDLEDHLPRGVIRSHAEYEAFSTRFTKVLGALQMPILRVEDKVFAYKKEIRGFKAQLDAMKPSSGE